MPDQETLERAEQDKREGKSPGTQAGEFVREEIHHVREGKHGARNTKQAIAIGLSKARRAGKTASPRRSRAMLRRLKREGRSAASRQALARQARSSARQRGPMARKRAAQKAVRTKGPKVRRAAARKAARTRRRHASA